ncbi:DUF4129 domain-containing protein [Neolewinella litorea]|nr:DUF4129 domain-containing protein [Neolewinella litorea]
MNFRPIASLLIPLLLPLAGGAQEYGPFPAERYRALREEVRFDAPPPAPTPAPAGTIDWAALYWPTFVLLTLVSVTGLGFLLHRIRRDIRSGAPARGGKDAQSFPTPELDEETVVRRGVPADWLATAEAEGRYDLAVRLRFLQLLGELERSGVLQWRRDFSNRTYLRQLAHHRLADGFRAVSEAYERYWYGLHPVDRLSYRVLGRQMEELSRRAHEGSVQASKG